MKSKSQSKSPLTLSLLIACLVIATLVMISHYFFRPGLEQDLKNKVISKLLFKNLLDPQIEVNGRTVILNGMVPSEREAEMIEAEIQSISGIHSIESQLQINNQFD